ncbi:MAG: glucose-6-phosphate dehydrogenase assembly protein OpcA [Chlamydiia bacterium]|nr:glucose-6-phosphate dehydrogenase assembly protein OpcA [Chlamydiia bacterium]
MMTTIQKIVEPDQIEPQLLKMWEEAHEKKKMRASLFNLIIFSSLSRRTDYFRAIVQKVVEKFPCRTLFITSDPDGKQSYLKTAVSVLFPQEEESSIACDQIDIGVAGSSHERVPFLILPHLLPDLPIYLLWAEDPSIEHPLFLPLSKLATRIIFDSEAADDLHAFSKTVLHLRKKTHIDIADLNWARTEGWRDLLSSSFDEKERYELLHHIEHLKITYNSRETEFFVHLKTQAIYLLAWLSSRLHWKCTHSSKHLHYQFAKKENKIFKASLHSALWEKLGSGTIIGIDIHMQEHHAFEAQRIPEQYHHVKILISSAVSCDLPYHFVLGQTATGQSLVQEICRQGTSAHFLDMLRKIEEL